MESIITCYTGTVKGIGKFSKFRKLNTIIKQNQYIINQTLSKEVGKYQSILKAHICAR